MLRGSNLLGCLPRLMMLPAAHRVARAPSDPIAPLSTTRPPTAPQPPLLHHLLQSFSRSIPRWERRSSGRHRGRAIDAMLRLLRRLRPGGSISGRSLAPSRRTHASLPPPSPLVAGSTAGSSPQGGGPPTPSPSGPGASDVVAAAVIGAATPLLAVAAALGLAVSFLSKWVGRTPTDLL